MPTYREAILEQTVKRIKTIPEIKTVRRYPVLNPKELEEIAHTQFPVVTIIGGLPIPETNNAIQLGAESYESSMRSNLDIFISIFGYNKNTPDSEISDLFNKIYKILYCDPEYKGFDHTSYETNADVYENEIVFTTENIAEIARYKFYERLTTVIGIDLSDEEYEGDVHWNEVTNLVPLINFIEVLPSSIIEFKNPYFLFRIKATINYNHYNFST